MALLRSSQSVYYKLFQRALLPIVSQSNAFLSSLAQPSHDPQELAVDNSEASTSTSDLRHESDKFTVSVVTGNLRGAGTSTPAYIKLIGTHGESDKVVVGKNESDMLLRGSTRVFDMVVPKKIGSIRRVHVAHDEGCSLSEIGAGWYLDNVKLQGPTGEVIFPCKSWFGLSDGAGTKGPSQRNLMPAVPEVLMNHHPVHIIASALAIPHTEKIMKGRGKGVNQIGHGFGGEDAYFYVHGRTGIFGMGVSDGVYMWHEQGIDSGLYSRALMEQAMRLMEEGHMDVFSVLEAAKRHCEMRKIQGSATMSLLSVDTHTGILTSANLGDSGFFVFGPDGQGRLELKFRTNQLEHEFGRPYQLGHHASANPPSDAELASFYVAPEDIIVMGSDGLLDNVSTEEILDELVIGRRSGVTPGVLVQRLMKLAWEHSMSKSKVTPYSISASEAFDMVYNGGKPDDICVLVAFLEKPK